MTRILAVSAVVLLSLAATAGFAQKKGDSATRSVQGMVTNPDDTPAAGAVVQLENTKTQQVRSYITKEDGAYRFFELSTEVDYKLKADLKGMTSPTKTLSSFDSKKQATLNLKLAPK